MVFVGDPGILDVGEPLESQPGWVSNVLLEHLQNHEVCNMIANTLSSHGFISESERKTLEQSSTQGENLLGYLLREQVTLQELQQILQLANVIHVLKLIKADDPVQIVHPTSDVAFSFQLGTEATTIRMQVGGFPPPKFQWFYGQSELHGQTKDCLNFTYFSRENEGDYVCRVTQELQTETREVYSPCFSLSVADTPPKITAQPSSLKLRSQEELRLKCEATSHPLPKYQWLKNGIFCSNKSNTGLLIIRNVDEQNAGNYCCKVENSCGFAQSYIAKVEILPSIGKCKPLIVKDVNSSESELKRQLHQFVELSFEVECGIPCHFEWYITGAVNNRVLHEKGSNVHTIRNFSSPPRPNTLTRYTSLLRYEVNAGDLLGNVDSEDCVRLHCVAHSDEGKVCSNGVTVIVTQLANTPSLSARNKWALLLANEDYKKPINRLSTPRKDVEKIHFTLTKMGFKCLTMVNLCHKEMMTVIEQFRQYIREGDYVIFHFAGHGFKDQRDMSDVMLPVHEEIRMCIPVNYVHTQLQRSKPALVFMMLDMCRTPHNIWKDNNREHAFYEVHAGNSFHLFATCPFASAEEEEGKESVMTKHLIQHLGKPILLREMASKVQEGVNYENSRLRVHSGSEQWVQVTNDLATARSLCDPINRSEFDVKLHQEWNRLLSVGGIQQEYVSLNGCNLRIEVKARLSGPGIANCIEVVTTVKASAESCHKLNALSLAVACSHTMHSQKAPHQGRTPEGWIYNISYITELQKLKGDLLVHIKIGYSGQQPEIKLFNLERPSIAKNNIWWILSGGSQLKKPMPHLNVPKS